MTRDQFLANLQALKAAGKTDRELIEHVRDFAAGNNIKFTIEHEPEQIAIPAAKPVVSSRRTKGGACVLDINFESLSIEVPDPIATRIFLSHGPVANFVKGAHTLLYYELNGLVLDTATWLPLVIPPLAFNMKPPMKIINRFLVDGAYDVINIDDGTVVTLYYYNDKWCLATAHGYDVTEMCWMGSLNYSEIIYDLVSRLYPEFAAASGISIVDRRLQFTLLNPSNCYTFGFRHHNFHPITSDPERMWYIQSVPIRAPYAYLQMIGIPMQRCEVVLSGTDILTLSKSAESHYGYILRSRNNGLTREFSHYILRSQKMLDIASIMYSRPGSEIATFINADNRQGFNVMRAILNVTLRTRFHELFPNINVSRELAYIERLITELVARIRESAPVSSAPVHAVDHLHKHITKCEDLAASPNCESVVRDYVISPEYALLYLRELSL